MESRPDRSGSGAVSDEEALLAYLWGVTNEEGGIPFGMTAEEHRNHLSDYIAERLSAALGMKESEDG